MRLAPLLRCVKSIIRRKTMRSLGRSTLDGTSRVVDGNTLKFVKVERQLRRVEASGADRF